MSKLADAISRGGTTESLVGVFIGELLNGKRLEDLIKVLKFHEGMISRKFPRSESFVSIMMGNYTPASEDPYRITGASYLLILRGTQGFLSTQNLNGSHQKKEILQAEIKRTIAQLGYELQKEKELT